MICVRSLQEILTIFRTFRKKKDSRVRVLKNKNFSKFPNRSYIMRYPAEWKAAALNARLLSCLIFHQVNRDMQSFKPALEKWFCTTGGKERQTTSSWKVKSCLLLVALLKWCSPPAGCNSLSNWYLSWQVLGFVPQPVYSNLKRPWTRWVCKWIFGLGCIISSLSHGLI